MEATRPHASRLVRLYAAPILLLIVALGQQVLVRTTSLSPWKGAGFGMFATADDPRTRVLRGSIDAGGARLPLDIRALEAGDSEVAHALRRARYLPTPSALESALRATSDVRWVLVESGEGQWLEPAPGDGAGGQALSAYGGPARLEVYSRHMRTDPLGVALERRAALDLEP